MNSCSFRHTPPYDLCVGNEAYAQEGNCYVLTNKELREILNE